MLCSMIAINLLSKLPTSLFSLVFPQFKPIPPEKCTNVANISCHGQRPDTIPVTASRLSASPFYPKQISGRDIVQIHVYYLPCKLYPIVFRRYK